MCKQEDPSLVSSIHVKGRCGGESVIPVPRVGPWGSLASRLSRIDELPVQRETLSSKHKVRRLVREIFKFDLAS